jgi:uncharacterized protein YndB with AHSA1/START domain
MGANEPLVIERTLNAPVSKVWEAITSKDAMNKWGFAVAAFEARPGFEFRMDARKDDLIFRHACIVREVIVNKKLSYSWRYEGYKGDSLVTYELFDEGDTTKVRLTHSGLETFANNGPDFARANFAEGWTIIIGTILKDIIEN